MIPYRQAILFGLASFFLPLPTAKASAEGEAETDRLFPAEISTVGMDHRTGAPVVLLRVTETGRVVPIWIGLTEARAIARALHDIDPPRPMTHDLMAALVRAGGNEIEKIVVRDIREGIYHGAVHLKRADGLIKIDSRPSDALALALRLDTPIRLAGKVIDESQDFQFVPPEEKDQVVRVFGLTAIFPSPEHREKFELENRAGALVTEASGAGSESGLKVGDLITEVDGNPVRNPMDLLLLTENLRPGKEVEITYRRGTEEHTTILVVPIEEAQSVPI